jgi:hypothetical protein
MSGLRRQKISLDDDPLAMMNSNPLDDDDDDDEEEIAPTPPAIKYEPKIPLPVEKIVPVVSVPSSTTASRSGLLGAEPTKKKSIFDDDDDDLLIGKPSVVCASSVTASVPVAATPASVASPPPATVNVQKYTVEEKVSVVQRAASPPLPPSKEDYHGDELFGYGNSTTVGVSSTEAVREPSAKVAAISLKAGVAKFDFQKDDDDISDLKVSKLLEKEENLDFNLFGKIESAEVVQQRVQMRLNDLEREDDFLRQLDELTSKASLSTSPAPMVSSTKATSTVSASASSASTTSSEFDISSFDINAYIAQESNESGGLFD